MHAVAVAGTWGYGIGLYGLAGPNACFSGSEVLCSGLGAAIALAWGDLNFTANGSWTFSVTADFGPNFGLNPWESVRRVQVIASVQNGIATVERSLIRAPAGSVGDGSTYDQQVDEWNADLISGGAGAGVNVLSYVTLDFDDAAMDVDGTDDRFTQFDVDALEDVIGTQEASAPEYTEWWDFNQSGSIDAADVDILQSLIDAGLGSGVLGDLNGDSIVNCDDYDLIGANWDYEVGDSNYRTEGDLDLDGDNDATDFDAVYEVLQPADVNDDGYVNTADVTAYLNLYTAQDPAADLNKDGQVNTQDWILFLNLWSNHC